jgi:protocatechuate 3,4-dioxygenase beta subunit
VLLTPKGFGDPEGRTPGKPAEPQYATTDASGAWTIADVKPGRYTLGASARGFLPGRVGSVDVTAGRDNGGLDIVLTAGGHALTGTVSDIGGGPVEGALVSVTRIDEGNVLSFDRAPAGALSDDDGRFAFQVKSGQYVVHAHHTDYVSDMAMTEVADGPRSVTLTMTPGATISGIVRAHPGGEPVAGAVVVAGGADDTGGFMIAGFGERRVVSDAEGRFSLYGLSSGVHGLTAVAPNHATPVPVEVALGVAEQVKDVEVWVETAYKISGFVVRRGHEEEGGLEGVLVGAFSLQPAALFAASAPSAEDGYFEIMGVRKGNYMVAAIGEEALPNFTGTGAQVEDKDVTDVLVVMDSGVALRGRVNPPKPATITISFDTESLGFSNMLASIGNAFVRGRAENDGAFELSPVAGGKLKLTATADDGSKGELSVEVGDLDQDGLVIELTPRATLAGRVVDAHGKPVAGATVKADPKTPKQDGGLTMNMNGMNPFGDTQATTTEDGAFAVRGLDPGAYLVSVSDRGPALAWAKPQDPEKPSEPIEVEVAVDRGADVELTVEARDGVIRGVVLDADGAPVVDAWVTAYREGSGKQMLAERTRQRNSGQRRAEVPDDEKVSEAFSDDSFFGEKQKPVLTDADGGFTIDELRTGTYTLVAEAEKGGSKARQKGVAPGSKVKLEVAALATIVGVVERAGAKVDDVTVTVEGPTDRSKRAHNGEFRIDRLEPGKYEVRARAKDGSAQTEVEVKTGESVDVKLELEGFGKLRGRLVDATGEPIAGMSVMVQPEKGDVNATQVFSMLTGAGPKTNDEGKFEVDEVPPGSGKVSFVDGGSMSAGEVAEAKYEIEGDGEKDLGTITGVRTGKVPKEERGDLGIATHVASFAKRPRPPDAEKDDRPAPDDADRLWVMAVDIDGPADTAGIEPGDEITAIDGQGVAGLGASSAAMLLAPHNVRAGQDVSIEIDHDGSARTISVRAKPKTDAKDPATPQ